MKKLKVIIGAFLAGQIATLFYKDQKFKKDFGIAKGWDKFKILWEGIFDLNKKIFTDAKSYDYEKKGLELKKDFDKQTKIIEKKFEDIKSQAGKLNKDKLQPMIDEIEEKIYDLKDQATDFVDDMREKYDIDNKVQELMKKFKQLKK